MSSRALPETFLEIPKSLATNAIRITYKLSLILCRYILATNLSTTQLCKMTTGYRQLTIYSKYKNISANLICKANGDLTGRLVQQGDCDHSDEMQQFFPGFSKRIQNWDLQNTPLFLLVKQLTRRQIQISWG